MSRYISIFFGVAIVAYPFAVYWGIQSLGIGSAALLIACLFLARLVIPASAKGLSRVSPSVRWLAVAGLLLALLSWIMNDAQWFRYYPVIVNALFLCLFAISLSHPPTMIERLARIKEPNLPDEGIRYTRVVTQIWCLFFFLNGLVALYTAVFASLESWTLYNGLISYLLIGVLFVGEFCFRQSFLKRV